MGIKRRMERSNQIKERKRAKTDLRSIGKKVGADGKIVDVKLPYVKPKQTG